LLPAVAELRDEKKKTAADFRLQPQLFLPDVAC